jgi:crotonobetainyl-CoA:carnitine CoA-transferase CaiB-like acyl-CoA transferase
VAYRQELDYWIGEWTAKYTPHQVMMLLQREGIAAAAVQTAEDLYRDPHLRERGFAREVFHPQIGWVTRAGASVRMIEHGFTPGGEAHVAGQDNEAVLSQILGMSRAEILDLSERQVLR